MVFDITAVNGGASSVSAAQVTGTVSSMIPLIVLFVAVLVIFGFLLVLTKYKTKIPVIEITRNGLKMKYLRVMRKKENKGGEAAFRYKVFMKNVTLPIPESPGDIYILDLKGNFIPAKIEDYSNLIKVKPADLTFWYLNLVRESDDIYDGKSFWDTYGTMIAGGLILVVIAIVLLAVVSKLNDVTAGLNAVAEAFRQGKVVLTLPQ